jgi:hypothetical protein
MFPIAQRSRTSYLFEKKRLLPTDNENGLFTEWQCSLCGWKSGALPTFSPSTASSLAAAFDRHECSLPKTPTVLPFAA